MDVCVGPRVSVDVLDLIENAKKSLWLISPYLQPWGRLEQSIQNAIAARDVDTLLLLRGGKDREQQKEQAKPFQEAGAKIVFLKRLHAKVYLNEKEAIVTSMNLLESSALDSWEIALRITRRDDKKLYADVVEACEKMLYQAQQATARQPDDGGRLFSRLTETLKRAARKKRSKNKTRQPRKKSSNKKSSRSSSNSKKGSCIRCATSIKLDINRPLCRSCWKKWAKYKNKEYEENYCLKCGEEHKSSFAKPMCYQCYKKFS